MRISSRVMITGKLRFSLLRKMVSETLVLGSPRMRLTAWSMRQALDGGVVDAGDQVAGLDAGAEGGRAFDRRLHLHQAVFHADLDADADELAAGLLAEFLQRLLVEVLRVRVQPGDHAGDGVADELLLVDLLDIVALDHAEDGGELLQFFQRQRRGGVARKGLQLDRGQGAGQRTQRDRIRRPSVWRSCVLQACSYKFHASIKLDRAQSMKRG